MLYWQMGVGVLINSHSGCARHISVGSILQQVRQTFPQEELHAAVICASSLEEQVKMILEHRPRLFLVMGGDGTISSVVAQQLVPLGIPLGILPGGTHNHFAQDAGIPLDLGEALQVAARGKIRTFDLGEVNGHFFVNNSSIGAYPRAIEAREKLMERMQLRKSVAMMIALWRVFANGEALRPVLRIDRDQFQTRTPFLFVGNNRYSFENGLNPHRPSVQEGELWVCTARKHTVPGMLALLWQAARGTLEESRDFVSFSVRKLEVLLARRESVRVSRDGELLNLRPPLRYAIHDRIFQVITPA
ncbi:MAG: diacylglycerol kinase family protein [Verrucomicrobiota bacterium]|nr:diacylglycerol kinase family protein [Verrucomicrobiota bacterium]